VDRQHVNIQHILASLALKATRQSVIIAKLSSYPRENRTKKALWELDNLRALNRGESYHKLVRAVAYAKGGKLRVRTDHAQQLYPPGVQAFMCEGKSYGLADYAAPIVFWYNRELCSQARVDPSEIKYWEDLLEAVKKCKEAGVTPIAVGGSEKWPLQFYPAPLMNPKRTSRLLHSDNHLVSLRARAS
jgi:hypothetical protein